MIKIKNLKFKIKKGCNSKFKIIFLTFILYIFAFYILHFTFITPAFALYRLPDKEPNAPIKMTKEYLPPEQKTLKPKTAAPAPQVTERESAPGREIVTPKEERNPITTTLNIGALLILMFAAAYLIYTFIKGSKK